VVIRSKDEADRLRLTLASLERQAGDAEVVVVNDGSRDHMDSVLKEAAGRAPLKIVRNAAPLGRSAAANAGARAARGDILLFLDGDTLAAPDLLRRHAAAHARRPDLMGRGETFHLRSTRFLADPEAATPKPGEEQRLARLSPGEIERMRITRQQVVEDFGAIARRAEAGVYPGAGPRRLQELELDALRRAPDCEVLWAAATGSNFSVPRAAFLEVGGFDPRLDINEHRELALRLSRAGLVMSPVEGARTYHMTHRSGWRDPLKDTGWEEVFYAAHPIAAVGLLAVFWASLSAEGARRADGAVRSLPELAAAARGWRPADIDRARAELGLARLRPAPDRDGCAA
jgi:GT2 family glycosyltransferase